MSPQAEIIFRRGCSELEILLQCPPYQNVWESLQVIWLQRLGILLLLLLLLLLLP